MSTNSIGFAPATAEQAVPISTQAPAFAAGLALAEMFGHLPSGYITVHNSGTARLGLQLENAAAFEAWRSALLIPSEDVELKHWDGSAWLSADGLFQGVKVHLTSFGVEVPAAEAVAA
ncbi:hypothetical protein ACH44C_27760 [Streptomyces purpureus]|uniref:hypothetical protein n=1 Tax=Streptomyces purpureus TaxID=1951 RepID=UPI00378D9341